MKFYSAYQFALFRILLGAYLFIHFTFLIPYSEEIWSSKGVLPDNSLNLTYGIFPSLLDINDSPFFIKLFFSVLIILSIFFVLGFKRRIVSLLLWYGWVCLFDRNNLISNPGIPFVGWILLCCVFIPNGEPLSLTKEKKDEWEFPKIIFHGAWIIMSLSYTVSGIDKLNSPSWRDGSAITHLLNNPLARDLPTRNFLVDLPETFLNILSWNILFLEIAFAPLVIWKKTRKWVWSSMIIMHLGILCIVDFADLTLGMLMIHWFTFDARWIRPKFYLDKKSIVFFDGICGLCNSTVDLLIKEDQNKTLLFAPLQGVSAKEILPESATKDLKSIVLFRNNKIFTQSDAIIEIGRTMGGFWGLSVILKIIPKFIRNYLYNLISNNRYNWFGKKETCRMPTEEERGKILI